MPENPRPAPSFASAARAIELVGGDDDDADAAAAFVPAWADAEEREDLRLAYQRQLPLADGEFSSEPRNTMDAIVSGCLHAQAGAIERMFSGVSGEPGAICLLTGGAAAHIMPRLNIPFKLVENLILDGLVRYGASQ